MIGSLEWNVVSINWHIINSAEVTRVAWVLSRMKLSIRTFWPISVSLRLWVGPLTCRLILFKPPWDIQKLLAHNLQNANLLPLLLLVMWGGKRQLDLNFPVPTAVPTLAETLAFLAGGGQLLAELLADSCSSLWLVNDSDVSEGPAEVAAG